MQRADALTHAKLARFDTRAPGMTLVVPRNHFNASSSSPAGGGGRVDLLPHFGLQPAQLTEAEATQVRALALVRGG